MTKGINETLLAAAIFFGVGVVLPAAQAKPSLGSTSVVFHRACGVCHGANGHGGRGPDLASGRWTHGSSDADLAGVIANGIPGSDMPGFGARFNEQEIAKLVAFVRSLSSGSGNLKIIGNAERGRGIYWGKGECTSCHMVSGQGGTLGPDLTRIGAQRSPTSLKDSLTSPSSSIANGYQGVRITQGARTVTGIRRNEDNFSIQVYDGERHHSFQKAEIEHLEVMPESLMPPTSLTPAEIDDVVAYLDTLRGRR